MAQLHLLGIAGSFMAGIARLAAADGHHIAGSDAAFYPPFGDEVKKLNCPLYQGYDADCHDRPADLYIIGNAISRGNPLLESILRHRRPFISAPQWLYENVLRNKHVLAVAGTHGKTTTSALLTYLLTQAGLAPGFLVGGMLPNFSRSAQLAVDSDFFVIEADEYDSAFFDKRPKFLHYHPRTAILNNLEFDHADIYPDVAAIVRQFHYLLRSVPDNGRIIAAANEPHLAAAIAMGCYTPIEYFGNESNENAGGDWHWRYANEKMQVWRGQEQCGEPFPPPLAGKANRNNVLAAIVAAAAVGVDVNRCGEYLQGFVPPLRRLQLLAENKGIRLLDDFAHHPTAISETIAALAEQGKGRLIAVFEPRSNTMKAGVFRTQWQQTFRQADYVVAVGDQPWLPQTLANCHPHLQIADTVAAAEALICPLLRADDTVVLMSNGDFGGLAARLAAFVNS